MTFLLSFVVATNLFSIVYFYFLFAVLWKSVFGLLNILYYLFLFSIFCTPVIRLRSPVYFLCSILYFLYIRLRSPEYSLFSIFCRQTQRFPFFQHQLKRRIVIIWNIAFKNGFFDGFFYNSYFF